MKKNKENKISPESNFTICCVLKSHLKQFWLRYHKIYVFLIFHFFKFLPTYDRNHFISAFETQIVCGRHIFVIYVKITAYYFGILYLKNVVVHFWEILGDLKLMLPEASAAPTLSNVDEWNLKIDFPCSKFTIPLKISSNKDVCQIHHWQSHSLRVLPLER